MCKFFSGLVTREKLYWNLDNDRHEDLIKEAGMNDTGRNPAFVRVELCPVDGNLANLAPENWKLTVDQDWRPEWFSAEHAEKEMRDVLFGQVVPARFVLNGQELSEIKDGRWFVCGGTISEVRGGTISAVWGGTISAVWGGTISEVWGGTISAVWGGTISEVWGGTISAVCGGTISEVWGGTISAVCGGTISAVWGGTISAVCGGTISAVCGGTISEVRGGTISAVWGGTISAVCGGTISAVWGGTISAVKEAGIVIDRTGDNPRIIVANKKIKVVQFKAPKGKP